MVSIGRIGVYGGDLVAEHATSIVDVFDGKFFGGQFRRGQVGQ